MSYIKPINKIPKKISTLFAQNSCNLENPFCTIKAQIELPSNFKQSQDGFVILTFGYIYFLIKNKKNYQINESIDLLNCQVVTFDEKAKFIKIKTNQNQNYCIHSKTSVLPTFYDYMFHIINIINCGTHSFNPQPQPRTFSVPYLIFSRSLYFIHSDMKKKIIPDEKIIGVDYFNDKKNYFNEILKINYSFKSSKYDLYYAKAIATEPRINKIEFQNFNHLNNNFLELIINNAPNVQEIIFNEYKSNQQTFNFKQLTENVNQQFSFVKSHSSIFSNFLNSLESIQTNIKSIQISSLDIQKSDLITFFDRMNKIKAFKNLTSFALSDIIFPDFPIDQFTEFLCMHEKLETLSLSKINEDGTKLFSAICECEPLICAIHMNEIVFSTQMISDEEDKKIFMPPNLVFVDLSRSKFIKDSLQSILKLLVSYCMKQNFLSVNLSYLDPPTNKWIKTFESIDLKKCNPNIIDFDWSGNCISHQLLDFILTQKGLKFLSLIDINLQNPKNFFEFFSKQLIPNMQCIIGIDIGSKYFDKEFLINFFHYCQNLKKLEHFYYKSEKEQNDVVDALSNLILSLPNLKEVSVELPELNQVTYLKLANSIIANKSILAANLTDIIFNKKKEPKSAKIESALKSIHNLKVPSTINIRADSLISIQKKVQENSIFDLATTINTKCSNHQIFEEENLDDKQPEIEIEEEEEVLSDDE